MITYGGIIMHIQKGYFFRKISKNRIIILNFSLIILIFCAVLTRINDEKYSETQVYIPLKNIETTQSVYSITINLNGKENKKDIKLLSQILKGLNVEGTFFASVDWINDNEDLMKQMKNDGHYFGMIIDYKEHHASRNKVIYYLATQNDSYYSKTGEYPEYIRIISDKSGKIPELINAFGQKHISSSLSFSNSETLISEGDIISVDNISSETPYSLASFISRCSSNGLKALSLNSLLSVEDKEETEISK